MEHLKDKTKRLRLLTFIVIIAFFIFYLNVHMFYRYENIDDGWFFSWIYNFIEKGVYNPNIFPHDWGVTVFGVLFATFYGILMKIFGFTKENLHYISLFLGYMSLVVWFFIIKKLFNEKIAYLYVVFLLLSEPFLSMVTQGRVESIGLFFLSITVLAFIYKQFLISGFFLMISFETHPATFIMALSFLVPLVFYYKKEIKKKNIYLFFTGILIGSILYIILHFDYINLLIPTLVHNHDLKSATINHPLYPYYFETKYYRNIVDLIILSICLIIYFKHYRLDGIKKLPFWFLVSAFIGETVIGRANFNYAIYFYIAFVLFIVWLGVSIKRLRVLLYILAFIWLAKDMLILYIISKKSLPPFNTYVENVRSLYERNKCEAGVINPNSYFALYNLDTKLKIHEHKCEKVLNTLKYAERFNKHRVCFFDPNMSAYHVIPKCQKYLEEHGFYLKKIDNWDNYINVYLIFNR